MRLRNLALTILTAIFLMANACTPTCYQGTFEANFEGRGTWTLEMEENGAVSGSGSVVDAWPQPIAVTLSGKLDMTNGGEVTVSSITGEKGTIYFPPPKDAGWAGDWTFTLQDGTLINGVARGHLCER